MKLKLYKKENESIKCLLCPHFCLLKEGEVGKCNCRKVIKNKIVLDSYGKITHLSVEPIKKKPFDYFLKDTFTLSLGLFGKCSLNCLFCENFEYTQLNKDNKYIEKTISDIINIAKEKNCKSICMSYNEPTVFFEFLIDLAGECHKNDLKFLIKTNAYLNEAPWTEVCKHVDAINADWKGSTKQYREVCGSSIIKNNNFIIDKIKIALDNNVHVEVSIPIYHNFLKINKDSLLAFINEFDGKVPIHLLRVTPIYKHEKYLPTTDKEINILAEYFKKSSLIIHP
jgi:pyruvate formate lyase activating enzyme